MCQPKQTWATGLRTKHRKRAHCVKNEKTKRSSPAAGGTVSLCRPARPQRSRTYAGPGHCGFSDADIPGQLKRAGEACMYQCGPGSVSSHGSTR